MGATNQSTWSAVLIILWSHLSCAGVSIWIPFNSEEGHVKVRLNDEQNLWLTLDTGNNPGILIPRQFAVEFGWFVAITNLFVKDT